MPRLHERLRRLLPEKVLERVPEKLRPPAWRTPEAPVPEWAQSHGRTEWTLGTRARVVRPVMTELDSKGHRAPSVTLPEGIEGIVTALGPDYVVFQADAADRGYRVPKVDLTTLVPQKERKWGGVVTAEDLPSKEDLVWHGLPVAIEARGGEERVIPPYRQFIPPDWVGMGYFDGLPAEDGDSLDVIVGPEPAEDVFLATQLDNDTGDFLQFKVMLGFADEAAAEAGFKVLWPAPMFGGLARVPPRQFLDAVLDKIVVDATDLDKAAGAEDVLKWHKLRIVLEARGGERRPTGDEQQLPAEWRGLGFFDGLRDRSDADEQEMDVVVGPGDLDADVYLAIQLEDGAFRQWKTFLGFASAGEVEAAYKLVWRPETWGGAWSMPAKRFRKLVLPRLTKEAAQTFYHGTFEDFVEPDPSRSGLGMHFGTARSARERLKRKRDPYNADQPKGVVQKYALSVTNPLRLRDLTNWHPMSIASELNELGLLQPEEQSQFEEANVREARGAQVDRQQLYALLRTAIERAGYDSVVYQNEVEHYGNDSFIVWDKSKIQRTAALAEHRERVAYDYVCPHCRKVIGEKDTYSDDGLKTQKHRACGGEIEFHTPEERAERAEAFYALYPSARQAMLRMEVDPQRVEPPHDVKNEAKLERLVESMRAGGWDGRPVLAYVSGGGYQAITGSHRLAAARAAGLERVPILLVEHNDFATNALYTLLDDAADNYDRLRALEKAVKANESLGPAYELMLQEVAEKNKARTTRTSALEVTALDVAAAKPKYCSHCGKAVTANELFGRGDRWFHRPCVTKGPIALEKTAEDVTRRQYREMAHRSVRAKLLGEIDGVSVYRVNGGLVRDTVAHDFAGGATGGFVPEGEVWVEALEDHKDTAANIVGLVVQCAGLRDGVDAAEAKQHAQEAILAFRESYTGGGPFRSAKHFLGNREAIELTAADLSGLQLKRKGYQRYVGTYDDEDGTSHKVWIGGEAKVEHGSYDGGKRQRRSTVWVVKVDSEVIGEEKSLKAAREMAEAHLGVVRPVDVPAAVAPPPVVAPRVLPALFTPTASDVRSLHQKVFDTCVARGDPLDSEGNVWPTYNKPGAMGTTGVIPKPGSEWGEEFLADPTAEEYLETLLRSITAAGIVVTAQDLMTDDESGPSEWIGHEPPASEVVEPAWSPTIHHPPKFEPPAPLSKKEREKRQLENLPALEAPPPLEEEMPKSPREEPQVAVERTYAQFKLKPNGGFDNIVNVLSMATPEELEFYGRWYDHAYEDIVELAARYKRPVPIVAALVAILSPNMPWDKNIEQAERLLQGQTRTSAYPENTAKALHVLRTGDLTALTSGEWGPKVGPFFESIAAPMAQRRRVVVDGHAANIWRGSYKNLADKKGPGGETIKGVSVGVKERAEMQNDYKRAGDAFGITPQAAQAVTWSLWRQLVEKNRRLEKRKKKSAGLETFGLIVPRSAVASLGDEAVERLVQAGWVVVGLTPPAESTYYDRPAAEPKREKVPVEKLKLKPDDGYKNIMKVLALATPEEREYWGKWYPFASSVVRELAARFDIPFESAAGVVAVMSPGTKWHQNVEVAKQIIDHWKAQQTYGPFSAPALSGVEGPTIEAPASVEVDEEDLDRAAQLGQPYTFEPLKTQPKGAPATVMKTKGPKTHPLGFFGPHPAGYPRNTEKALAILNGAAPESVLTGPKVTVFYQSLLDPASVENHLVLDGHAINIWRGQKRSLKGIRQPNEAERAEMVADYERAAATAGLSVQAVQAITWFIWKSVTGQDKTGALQGSLEEAAEMRAAGYTHIAVVYGSSTPTYLRAGEAERLRKLYGDDIQVMALDDYLGGESPTDVEVAAGDLRVAYMREKDTPGESAGVFLRLPEKIAAQWSKDGREGEDESPPHFTVLYLGPTPAERRGELIDLVRQVASSFGPMTLDLAQGVQWFENHKGQQIAHKSLEPESEGQLRELHEALKKAAVAAGFEVKHKEPFIAHATLAYCDSRDYPGPVPEGSFTTDELEVWGWPEDSVVAMSALPKAAAATRMERWAVKVTLAGPMTITAAELTAAKKRRRKEKRHRFAGEVYWLPKDETIARTRSVDAGTEAVEIRLDPGARVLREGERDLIDMGAASLDEVMKMALEKGYDAVRVKDRLAILNQDAIAERTPTKARPGWI